MVELARPGHAQGAIDADQITKVEFLGEGPALLADLFLAHHHLNKARPGFEFARTIAFQLPLCTLA